MEDCSIKIIATNIAREHDLPAALILAIIQVESAGNEWATRFEPDYRWLINVRTGRPFTVDADRADEAAARPDFPAPDPKTAGFYSSRDTEWIGQKTSWGLMQIMGAVAREHGYTGPLPRLCDAVQGITYGCKHLAHLRDRHRGHSWAAIVDAYNDGNTVIEHAHDYPHKVAAVSAEAAEILELP